MSFFTLKELEKIAPATKKITFQSVKETLMALCADNLVRTDKIGTSNYFWSFPSEAKRAREDLLARLHDQDTSLANKLESLSTRVTELRDSAKNSVMLETFFLASYLSWIG
jgi:hypothetical protein